MLTVDNVYIYIERGSVGAVTRMMVGEKFVSVANRLWCYIVVVILVQ